MRAAQRWTALAEILFVQAALVDRKSTRLNSSHVEISYAVFCLKKKKQTKSSTRSESKKIAGSSPVAVRSHSLYRWTIRVTCSVRVASRRGVSSISGGAHDVSTR